MAGAFNQNGFKQFVYPLKHINSHLYAQLRWLKGWWTWLRIKTSGISKQIVQGKKHNGSYIESKTTYFFTTHFEVIRKLDYVLEMSSFQQLKYLYSGLIYLPSKCLRSTRCALSLSHYHPVCLGFLSLYTFFSFLLVNFVVKLCITLKKDLFLALC